MHLLKKTKKKHLHFDHSGEMSHKMELAFGSIRSNVKGSFLKPCFHWKEEQRPSRVVAQRKPRFHRK